MDTTTTLGLVKPMHGINIVEGETATGQPQEAHNLDVLDAAIAALQGVPQGTFLVSAPPTDQTITGGFKVINTGGFQGPLAGDVQESVPAAKTVSAAISEKQGVIRLGSAGALAMTIADPTTGTDDGKRLTIVASTAQAHVITVTGGLAGGTNNTLTLGGAIGDMAELEAIAGKWFLRPSINATASHV
jgi:hypothetical protein